MEHFQKSIGQRGVVRPPLIHKHHGALPFHGFLDASQLAERGGNDRDEGRIAGNLAMEGERMLGRGQKVAEGQRHQRVRRKKEATATSAAHGTAIFALCRSWSFVAAATCIRLHKSWNRFTISPTNKRWSDRPKRLHRDLYPAVESTCFIALNKILCLVANSFSNK